MKQHKLREKSSSLKKSKGPPTNMPKAMLVRELPKYAQGSSGKKSLKDTKRKQPNNSSSIEQRVANIKRGFVELENKLSLHQQSRTTGLGNSDVKRLLDSESKLSRTRRDNNERTPHKCVFEKAVYSLISIIDQQKFEIDHLRKQLQKRCT